VRGSSGSLVVTISARLTVGWYELSASFGGVTKMALLAVRR